MNTEEPAIPSNCRLVEPYGGRLVNMLAPAESAELADRASRLNSIQLSQREVCDFELLATGAFSPLDRFMGQADLESVIAEMRLRNGLLFPMPITLSTGDWVEPGSALALRDRRNELIGVMVIEEIFEWDRRAFLNGVAGSEDLRHPLVAEAQGWGKFMISGNIELIAHPTHYDFAGLRKTPSHVRTELIGLGNPTVVAFQTRNPIHRAHEAVMKQALERTGGSLLIHPTVGVTKPGDIDQYTRVLSYQAMLKGYFDTQRTILAVLPLAMRMAGPREALWHMIVRRNYGADHFLVGRDHASPGVDSNGRPFYDSSAAVELAQRYSGEIGVEVVDFNEMVYEPQHDRYVERPATGDTRSFLSLSGTQVRDEYLGKGVDLPEWFSRPEVSLLLSRAYPPKKKQGFCIWLTGLSGAGKSTIADILELLLSEKARRVTVLDGDVVRLNLSKGLGFSREDRDTNVLRIGFVAAEIVRHGGIAICAAISPFLESRAQVRSMFPSGSFIEVFVDTPVAVCEQRDTKGLYAKARRGEIKGFTGIDDPYEEPVDPEVLIETTNSTPHRAALVVIEKLSQEGFLET